MLNCTKINRPEVSGIYHRESLFAKIDRFGSCPVIWIAGPPGSGKTALAGSYLESRGIPCIWYRMDIEDTDPAVFFHFLELAGKKASSLFPDLPVSDIGNDRNISGVTGNFLSQFFSNPATPSCVIFDNYQDIPEDLPLHDHIIDAVRYLPEDTKIIIISRNQPSEKFSRLRANRMLRVIGWQDLRFTGKDLLGVEALAGSGNPPEKVSPDIYEKLDGWITGFLMLLEKAAPDNGTLTQLDDGIVQEIFLYFAEEVFDRHDADIKRFLLKTSCLVSFSSLSARDMTGNEKAEKILEDLLYHANIFTEKRTTPDGTVYTYHPLFREFLTQRMKEYYSPDEIRVIKQHAATILRNNNLAEEAVALFREAGEKEVFVQLVVQLAPDLVAKGKHRLLEEWLAHIPRDQYADNPWLSYWLGACLQQSNPPGAGKAFHAAFESFYGQRQTTGAFAAWAATVDSIIMEWNDFTRLDPLIYWLEFHYKHESSDLDDETRSSVISSMTEAMMIRRPDSEELVHWVDLAVTEAQRTREVNHRIRACIVAAKYYLWLGDQGQCWFLLGRIRGLFRSTGVSTLNVLKIKLLECLMYTWYRIDAGKCLETFHEAFAVAESAGLHVMDDILFITGAGAAMNDCDYTKAAEFLHKIEDGLDETREHGFFAYHYISAWLSLLRGNTLRAGRHIKEAGDMASKTGHIFHQALVNFAAAQILFVQKKCTEASERLVSFEKTADAAGSRIFKFMALLTRAYFLSSRDGKQAGMEYLQEAMLLGRREKYWSMLFWWDPAVTTRLCMLALENNIEPEYVKEIIIRRDLVPEAPPVEIEQWPWMLRIYTLGRFAIVNNGKPLSFKGKAQQKPLNMLKALITLGGRGVSAFQLADVLWPDADGDMQNQALATTLHRLRRILGRKEIIEFYDGQLSLNPRYCWVDAWAFERMLSTAETGFKKGAEGDGLTAAMYAEKAVALYKGNFLPQNNMEYSCVHMREHLKSRFLRGVILLGRSFEKLGEKDKALLLYLKALEIDPMMEEFYQRLMICYQRLGRNAEAVSVYKRCQKNFEIVLRVAPSAQTKAIYGSLLNQCPESNNDSVAELRN